MKFADIIVDISHEKLDRTFQYIIPEQLSDMVMVGTRVEVPFGKGGRLISGYVIGISETPQIELQRMKEIHGIPKGSIPIESKLIALAYYIKEQYGSTMNQALKTVIPVKREVKQLTKKYIRLKISKEEARNQYAFYVQKKNMQSRARLLKELCQTDVIEKDEAIAALGVSASVIQAMEKAGMIAVDADIIYRNPLLEQKTDNEQQKEIVLNDAQKKVADAILTAYRSGEKKPQLIYGVTGSGKTEVYMEIIEEVLRDGKEVIVLIPEISLTFQTIQRFYGRFGSLVTVINSKLSGGEKYDQFERAKNGEVRIVIGPRSALFTPFRHLGLIVIDEEHEGAYKSDQVPKYHAREVALKRAELEQAMVVLGSATPAISTYYQALHGKYQLHQLPSRAGNAQMANVHLVDLRKELEEGNKDIFSRKLVEYMRDRLAKKEQIMLFLNRRGYSSFVSCRSCGKSLKCPHCDVSLTLHKQRYQTDQLECHYCGYRVDYPNVCPSCGSKYIGRFGIGTEQVEERIGTIFPEARTLRMDMDTTKGKGEYERILSSFGKGEADILVGTQMIVKGHDFPNVTLVGVLAADLSLHASDYMAGERTFQLLTQAAGRAGRGEKPGEVIIQSYNLEEAPIKLAVTQNYEAFYETEIAFRQLLGYPPVEQMMAIMISDSEEALAEHMSKDIGQRIQNSKIEDLLTLGPNKASISKINDYYRYVIYMKHRDTDILIKVKNAIEKYVSMVDAYKHVQLQFDFNPMSGY